MGASGTRDDDVGFGEFGDFHDAGGCLKAGEVGSGLHGIAAGDRDQSQTIDAGVESAGQGQADGAQAGDRDGLAH